jgi:RNA polymerase sigma-70 factor (ECF subfamily)
VQRELVERAIRGDRDAFAALVSASVDRLFAAATLILRDRSTAEDAVQEALTRMWHDLPQLRNPDRFDPWLHRILTRACYDQAHVQRRRRAELTLIPGHEPAVNDESGQIADRDVLSRGFRRLSVEHRTALVLRHYSGLSVPDMAASMSVPLGTAKSRLHHAERALRAALEADARAADNVKTSSA